MNIALIGYRGTGKSTVGQRLATLLHMDFVDTDTLLVERAGLTIKAIFDAEGEAGFRDRESAIVREVAVREGIVIAAGGGVVLRSENVAALKARCKIVWLEADALTLHDRIRGDAASFASRPNLTDAGGIAEVESLLKARTPLYRAAADFTIHVGDISPEQVAEKISQLF